MKWREVKVLCAGMCVCTVVAAGPAIWENRKEQGQLADAVELEQGTVETEYTERSIDAGVEKHEVYEVGVGASKLTEEAGSAFSLRGNTGEEEANLVNDSEPLSETEVQDEPQTEQESNLIIADVTNYVNIRSLPSEEGEILGKLYDDSVGRRHGEENGWYYIESGSVKGYVKGEFVLTGEAAEIRAEEVGTRLAEVTTTTLKVRKNATTDSAVLGLVPGGRYFKCIGRSRRLGESGCRRWTGLCVN